MGGIGPKPAGGWPRSRRPQGQPTRGKTARNRLRRVDTFFLLYAADLLRAAGAAVTADGGVAGAFFVDLGYGAEPATTLETAARFRKLAPRLRILGVEIDPARVAAAQPFADALTSFRRGGFNLPLACGDTGRPESACAVRAFNVLRQYEEAEVASAYAELARHVLPGGLLVEGTSDPLGRLWVANVARRRESDMPRTAPASQAQLTFGPAWEPEALVFSTNFRSGCEPANFQPVLPKNYIHRMVPGEPIFDFFAAWAAAAQRTLPARTWGQRYWFSETAHDLAKAGYQVALHPRWLRRGYLVVRQPLEGRQQPLACHSAGEPTPGSAFPAGR
jgi:hypothetical protein